MNEITFDDVKRKLLEDHEVVKWVDDHGGIKNVKNQCQFAYDAVSWIRKIVGCKDDEVICIDDAMQEVELRLMPKGYEWPCFEDGEKAKHGDKAVGYIDMDSFIIDHINFFKNGEVTVCCEAGDNGKCENFARLFYGDRLKRCVK